MFLNTTACSHPCIWLEVHTALACPGLQLHESQVVSITMPVTPDSSPAQAAVLERHLGAGQGELEDTCLSWG